MRLTLPLDVERTKMVRPGPSGSATYTELHARGRVAVRFTLPLDVERTKAVRSGPSGSVGPSDLRANRRCADAKTCLQGAPLERASSEQAQTLPKTVLPRAAGGLLAEESLGRSD